MKLTIYYPKDDSWVKQLKEYAKSNKRSVSFVIREIMSKHFSKYTSAMMHFTDEKPVDLVAESKEKLKLTEAELEAEVLKKIKPTGKSPETCDQLNKTEDGYSCYKMANWVMNYQPFCQACWERKDLWGDKARILKSKLEKLT